MKCSIHVHNTSQDESDLMKEYSINIEILFVPGLVGNLPDYQYIILTCQT